jgi:hypothetical protein
MRCGSVVDNAVLSQNAVVDVFQLCHHSEPRALVPSNEDRLVVHASPLRRYALQNPLRLKATTLPSQNAIDGTALRSAMSSLDRSPKRIAAILFSKMRQLRATSC